MRWKFVPNILFVLYVWFIYFLLMLFKNKAHLLILLCTILKLFTWYRCLCLTETSRDLYPREKKQSKINKWSKCKKTVTTSFILYVRAYVLGGGCRKGVLSGEEALLKEVGKRPMGKKRMTTWGREGDWLQGSWERGS